MPTVVGTLRNITFQIFEKGDEELGNQVRLQLARYAQESNDIKMFINETPPVTVNIKTYAGSGAVTIYRTNSITVSRSLKGGAAEIAESTLFELCNFNQGNFSTREHDRCKRGAITPMEAGRAIASCEARSIYMHGVFLRRLKSASVPLSNYGVRNLEALGSKDQGQVTRQTMITPHDESGDPMDQSSLLTPNMYFYQMINSTYMPSEFHVPIQIRGIAGGAPPWMQACIAMIWGKLLSSDKSLYYVKVFDLARAMGLQVIPDYDFPTEMRRVAKADKPAHVSEQSQIAAGAAGVTGAPGNLLAKLKEVGFA